MRELLAVVAALGLPILAGMRWVDGDVLVRMGLGGLLGAVAAGAGAIVAGLVGAPGAPVLGAAVGLLGAWLLGPRVRVRIAAVGPPHEAERRILWVVVGVGVLLAVLAVARPVPGWDGWAIWSLKAKSLAVTGDFLGPVFTATEYAYSHPDYPPLLPALQASLYQLAGARDAGWPLQVQLVWLWGCGGAGLVGLLRHRGTVPLLLGASWLLAPHVVRQAISGYADVPMAMLLITGAALLADGRVVRWAPAALLLAGAGLMKNEGLVLALAVAGGAALLHPDRRSAALAAAGVTIGAFAPWAAFVVVQGLPNDVVVGLAGAAPGPLEALGRIPPALGAVVGELLWVPRWGVLSVVCPLVLAWSRPRERGLVAAALAGLVLFIGVYAVTPRDFDWHVAGSVDRVVTAPLGLLALAAATSARSAGEARATAGRSPRPAPEGSAGR
jgi:hypothetical protein